MWILMRRRRQSYARSGNDGEPECKLVVLPSPYRELTRPLLRYIARLERRIERYGDCVVAGIRAGEVVATLLHNQSSLMLKGALLFKEGVIVISVPYHLEK